MGKLIIYVLIKFYTGCYLQISKRKGVITEMVLQVSIKPYFYLNDVVPEVRCLDKFQCHYGGKVFGDNDVVFGSEGEGFLQGWFICTTDMD